MADEKEHSEQGTEEAGERAARAEASAPPEAGEAPAGSGASARASAPEADDLGGAGAANRADEPGAAQEELAREPAAEAATTPDPEKEPPAKAEPPKAEPGKGTHANGGGAGHPAASAAHGEGTQAAHGGGGHAGHGDDHSHGLSHVMSKPMLIGVWAGLMFLTLVTVAVTKVDLGASANLMVAMVIATIKAVMVMAFFMHLLYDRRFNVLVFLSSVLFVVLFLTLTIQDRAEYQPDLDEYRLQQRSRQ